MRILGTFLPTGETYTWESLDDAVRFTRIPKGYILMSIRNGRRWRRWLFDEAI